MDNKESDKAADQQPDHTDEPSAGSMPPKIESSSLSELSESSSSDTVDQETFLGVPQAQEDKDEDEDKNSTMLDVADSAVEQSNEESSDATFQCRYCDKSYNNEKSLKRHLRERRSKCSKDRLGVAEHGGNVFACSRCHAETSKKFSTERHINDACWKVCDECCESGHAACNAIYVDGACEHCLDNRLSCTKRTGPVCGVHYQLLSGDASQPLKTGPKSSRSGRLPAAKGEAIKRKATTSPDASPRSKPVGKKDKIEHSHLRDNITLQSASQPQTFTGDEKLQEWRRVQNAAPSSLRDNVSAVPPSGPTSMAQASWNQPGGHPAAHPRAPRLRSHFPGTDGPLQQGRATAASSDQTHERHAKDFVASAPGSRMPSRQSSAEPTQHPRAPKAVARKLTKKVAWERSVPTGENDPAFRLRIFGNSYGLDSYPIFSILTIRTSQKFGPRLDAYCQQRNKRYGVDWIFIYRYVIEKEEEERYIEINYDMTPLDVYDRDRPNIKLRDMDTLVVMKGKSHLAAKVEGDRKGVQIPSSPVGEQVSEQVIDIEDGETPFHQNASTLTSWHRMIELKLMELRTQVVRMDSEVVRQKQLGAQKDKTIAEMMAREAVIQEVLCANRVVPAGHQVHPRRDQNGAGHAVGPVRTPANARPNQFMARLESVREPAQPPMPRQPLPQYRFPTEGRRPDNRAAQDSLPGFDDGVIPPFEQTSHLLRQAGYPDGADLMAYLHRAQVGRR